MKKYMVLVVVLMFCTLLNLWGAETNVISQKKKRNAWEDYLEYMQEKHPNSIVSLKVESKPKKTITPKKRKGEKPLKENVSSN